MGKIKAADGGLEKELNELHEKYLANRSKKFEGGGMETLFAIDLCFLHGVFPPAWAVAHWRKGMMDFMAGKVKGENALERALGMRTYHHRPKGGWDAAMLRLKIYTLVEDGRKRLGTIEAGIDFATDAIKPGTYLDRETVRKYYLSFRKQMKAWEEEQAAHKAGKR